MSIPLRELPNDKAKADMLAVIRLMSVPSDCLADGSGVWSGAVIELYGKA